MLLSSGKNKKKKSFEIKEFKKEKEEERICFMLPVSITFSLAILCC